MPGHGGHRGRHGVAQEMGGWGDVHKSLSCAWHQKAWQGQQAQDLAGANNLRQWL